MRVFVSLCVLIVAAALYWVLTGCDSLSGAIAFVIVYLAGYGNYMLGTEAIERTS